MGLLQGQWLDPLSAEEADKLGECITGLITEALDTICPIKPGIKHQLMPWWSTKIADMRRKVRLLLQSARRQDSSDEYKAYHCIYKAEIRYSKKCAWEKFCSDTESMKDISRLNKILMRGWRREIGFLKTPNGTYTVSPDETLDLLMDTHFPSCQATNPHRWPHC